MQYSRSEGGVAPGYDEGEDMVRKLQANQTGVDDKLHQAQIQLFRNRQLIDAEHSLDLTIEGGEGSGDDSEAAESEDSESDSEEGEDEEEDDEEEEEEESSDEEEEQQRTAPSSKRMPQEQIEVTPCIRDLLDAAPMHCRLT